MKIHLISYGDMRYEVQREFFKESALFSSFFDEVTMFTNEDLEVTFTERFYEILQFSKGGGYMIWKPYFIKRVLDLLEEGDILIYCDAGCMINDWGKERFKEYIEKLISSETGIITFEMELKEYQYTKREVFEYFNVSKEIINSKQIISGIILIRKCTHTCMMIDKWNQTLYDNPWLFTDKLDPESQHPDFIAHRHDQSIFSVILKMYGAEVLPDETYFDDFMREGQFFPFWATRMGYF
ncbi:hypothetical protein SAMN05421820_103361 [Pedobacter steynii]|uniref:Uncharacterized protein n=1 Tax=Pedobacter steynii TaxID=430522 RepID=A0A1G9RU45_9SPHI|nr:hypothetical protein [Pedobacter steynii]NQX37644.1 hypothetical protein [Pedobacter steynii]SDM26798.1 hypothetical protein SAMN05421820_103361 [Pedobacter steynii]